MVRPPQENPQTSDLSIVIPTYNRPQRLERCLQALCLLEYPKTQFEVVIVDDGGREPLDDLIASFSNRLSLRLLRQDNAGPATARNAGVRAAKGRFIALTDDDCTPAPDWLSALKKRFQDDPDCAFAGLAENGLPKNAYSTASQLLIDYLCGYYNLDRTSHCFGTSNNLAFPRDAFIEIGGFDESFPLSAAEDRELIDRWVSSGKVLIYAPEVIVVHYHQMNLRTYCRQHANYGRGAYHYHRIRALRTSDTIKLEPLSFYYNMMGYPFKRGHGVVCGTWVSILIGWSQFMTAVGFFREKLSMVDRD